MKSSSKEKVKIESGKSKTNVAKGGDENAGDEKPERLKRRKAASEKVKESSPQKVLDADSETEVGPDEFLVILDMNKTTKGLGIEVDWANGKSLLIKAVKKEGAVPNWNKDRPPNQSIHAEDHVLAVNGKQGDPKAMLAECRGSKRLKLLVWAHCERPGELPAPRLSPKRSQSTKRKLADAEAKLEESLAKAQRRYALDPTEHLVTLDMRRSPILGLDVDWQNGKTLYIKSVHPGAMEEWNRLQPPERTVQAGDSVLAVNGYAGDARGMAGLCKELCGAQSQLQLRIRGPPPPPTASAKTIAVS